MNAAAADRKERSSRFWQCRDLGNRPISFPDSEPVFCAYGFSSASVFPMRLIISR
jgi:hypothetical protein